MTGKAAGQTPAEEPNPAAADALEVAPGWGREKLEGWIPELANQEEVCSALEKAFDYRGDITITKKDGSKIEGYVFDRRSGPSLTQSCVRLFPKNSDEKVSISYADIAALTQQSVNSVGVSLLRARDRLRRDLETQGVANDGLS